MPEHVTGTVPDDLAMQSGPVFYNDAPVDPAIVKVRRLHILVVAQRCQDDRVVNWRGVLETSSLRRKFQGWNSGTFGSL